MINILVIKLGALGDVVRTLSILPAIKEKYPNSNITWVTKQDSLDIIKNSPYINEILTIENKTYDRFDILYNFDIEKEATELAKKVNADKKYGFSCDEGFPIAFNFGAEYYLNTLFDDFLKKTNKKTYQEMMFEAAELTYKKQPPLLILSENNKQYATEYVTKNNIDINRLIGIHLGASPRWPSKKWHKDNLKEFIIKARQQNYNILLFGGPNEVKEQNELFNELKEIEIYRNNPDNSINEFIALVNICTKMICSDSFALHISLALKKPAIGLFFCTPPDEVEDYGLLKKIVSPLLDDFFPEKMNEYSEELVKSISAQEVLDSL